MSSASAAIGLRFRHLLGRMRRPADPLPPGFPPLPNAHSRHAAAAVLAMAVGTLLILALPRPPAMTTASTVNVAEKRLPAGPVRIVGATPRSDNCDEQVWPYIEHRCLARAERAKASAAATDAPVTRSTTGATAAEPGAPEAAPARSRVATASLALPRQRVVPADTDRVGMRAWRDIEVGQDGAEGIVLGEPQRRTGRRAYRHRTRSFFPFPF